MARFNLLAVLAPMVIGMASVFAAPISNVIPRVDLNAVEKRANGTTFVAGSFANQAYADFQISDGVAGNAQAEANAVFVDPFNGVDLSTVDSDTVETINTMREAAESAETDDFDPQIDAASGDAATALQNGKIKNKVLKLTGEVQALNIKIAVAQASGSDTSDLESQLATEQKKLTTNIATDTKNAGQTSQGVTGGSSSSSASSAASSSSAAASSSSTASAKKAKSSKAAKQAKESAN
ncbi:hypothetical protein IEO21_01230 [Rhodonia placenta]|uniref:Small secreted protein n=1 Tax=Rhodonia placenta TaxID=104341 RepID=A0A8H7PA31_9APHY|nr:hypothetical protein IEO21_01230 [Postia placenta]